MPIILIEIVNDKEYGIIIFPKGLAERDSFLQTANEYDFGYFHKGNMKITCSLEKPKVNFFGSAQENL